MSQQPGGDHDCWNYRILRLYTEGDDVMVHACRVCLKVLYEPDGVRPMAWYLDKSRATGVRYAWNPIASPEGAEVWKHPDMGLYAEYGGRPIADVID